MDYFASRLGGTRTIPKDFEYTVLRPDNADYPSALVEVFGAFAAPEICIVGNLALLKKASVGFCGSRNASENGLSVARECASQLAENNVVVTSGYARGVDTVSHYSALFSGGATIIVLPEGIQQFRIKKELKPIWDWDRILVVSQFAPNAVWRSDRAMERNKLIVALSTATFVVEAGSRGGTLNAGMTALNLKRPLFVANYAETKDSNEGNKILIEMGGIKFNKKLDTGYPSISRILESVIK